MEIDMVLKALSTAANIVVAVSVFFVWKQLSLLKKQGNDDHERSRKETLVDVMREWNREVGPVTAAAQKLVSQLNQDQCRKINNIEAVSLSTDFLPLASAALGGKLDKKILIEPKDSFKLNVEQSAHLRFLAINYLNTLETSISAWDLEIVDSEKMEEEFNFLIDQSMTDPSLTTFRKILGKDDGFPSLRKFINTVTQKHNGKEKSGHKLGQS